MPPWFIFQLTCPLALWMVNPAFFSAYTNKHKRSLGPVYLSQRRGSGSWPLLLWYSEQELCQIWTSCSSPCPSLCWSLLETVWTGLRSHTKKKDRQHRVVRRATQTAWRHHTCMTLVTLSLFILSLILSQSTETISYKSCHFLIWGGSCSSTSQASLMVKWFFKGLASRTDSVQTSVLRALIEINWHE